MYCDTMKHLVLDDKCIVRFGRVSSSPSLVPARFGLSSRSSSLSSSQSFDIRVNFAIHYSRSHKTQSSRKTKSKSEALKRMHNDVRSVYAMVNRRSQ